MQADWGIIRPTLPGGFALSQLVWRHIDGTNRLKKIEYKFRLLAGSRFPPNHCSIPWFETAIQSQLG